MRDTYNFFAIFSYDKDGISIEFPDVSGCTSFASTTEEAIESAKEALALHLYGMECDNDPIPEPTKLEDLKLDKNQAPILIDVFMPILREKLNNKSVKKTLTIPNWLNICAERQGVNFSLLLQEALREKLHV